MKRTLILLVVVFVSHFSIQAQYTDGTNIDFSQGNFNGWQGYLGSCGAGININPSSITAGHHTIMNRTQLIAANQLVDEHCMLIPKVPDGFSYSAKIGNSNIGAEVDAIEYTLKVDSSNCLFLLHYAWVIENLYFSDHSLEEQPRFSVIIKDSVGNPIPEFTCMNLILTEYSDFQNYTCFGGIVAKGWDVITFDLSSFIGKTIKLYFETRDCALSGHFGYAYIVGETRPKTIDIAVCDSSIMLKMPDGFADYCWSWSSVYPGYYFGSQYHSVSMTDLIHGEEFTCFVYPKYGYDCFYRYTFSVIIDTNNFQKTYLDMNFAYGVMENGIVDFESNNNQNWFDTCSRTATFVDLSQPHNCTKDSILWTIDNLNVTSKNSFFTYKFPNPTDQDSAIYKVRLIVYASNSCSEIFVDTMEQSITIYSSLDIDIQSANLFMNSSDTLTAIINYGNLSFSQWDWILEDNTIGSSAQNPIIINNKGSYTFTAVDFNGCEISSCIQLPKSSINAHFGFGILKNGNVDFAGNNYENQYDTANRIITFVDLSGISNCKKDKISWILNDLITISNDSVFTYTFPEPDREFLIYKIRLIIEASNGCFEVLKDTIDQYITVYRSEFSNQLLHGKNLDFSLGNFAGWQGYAGTTEYGTNINKSTIIPGRHTIMNRKILEDSSQLMDEHCTLIPKVPPGFAYSAKIGNDSTGAEMEAIEYTLKVDSSNSLFLWHFAWVMEDPSHSQEEQPRFLMRIKDSIGNDITWYILPCSYYSFVPYNNNIDGLTCTGSLLAQGWKTAGISLEPLIGKTVKLYFETRDCALTGHFGYAYVIGEVRPMAINVTQCNYSSAISLTAPDGYSRYYWTRSSDPAWNYSGEGPQYQSILITDPVHGEEFTCITHSKLSPECSSTLTTIIDLNNLGEANLDVNFGYGVMENGNVDFAGNNNQNWYDTCLRTATFVDLSHTHNCKKDSIRWEIDDLNTTSNNSMFTYTFPNSDQDSATHTIRLIVWASNNCQETFVDTMEQSITVYKSIPLEAYIKSANMLTLDSDTLSLIINQGAVISYLWEWKLNDGSAGSSVENPLIISDYGIYSATIITKNNCHDTTFRIKIPKESLIVDFGFGVMENGNVDFAGNNNQNWYDTCSRTVTFVDLSQTYNCKKKNIHWEIEELSVTSNDSLFTFTFPQITDNSPVRYTIRLIVEAENDFPQQEYLKDTIQQFIMVYPSLEAYIERTNTSSDIALWAVVTQGTAVSYLWTWQSDDGTGGNFSGNPLLVSGNNTYKVEIKDSYNCFLYDSIEINDVSNTEFKQNILSLGQNIPNPAKDKTIIPYTIAESGEILFFVHTVTGQLLYQQKIKTEAGNHTLKFNTSNLSAGVYFYSMEYKQKRIVQKMIIE
jgi:hypothetical protein